MSELVMYGHIWFVEVCSVFVAYGWILLRLITFRFVWIRFFSFRLVSLRFVSFRFVSFRFVSFRFVSFHFTEKVIVIEKLHVLLHRNNKVLRSSF